MSSRTCTCRGGGQSRAQQAWGKRGRRCMTSSFLPLSITTYVHFQGWQSWAQQVEWAGQAVNAFDGCSSVP
eukprot:scaffold255984_cov22-Tisochrysis_lutea.AAC.1